MKLIPILLALGMLAVSGWAEDEKPEPYSPELVKKAEAGDAKAQYNLGVCYYQGNGVTQDFKEAVMWWTKSAEQGNGSANFRIGVCYYFGEGVTQDYEESTKFFNKAGAASQKIIDKLKSK